MSCLIPALAVTRIQRRKSVDYATLISRGDPHTIYHNFSKLGDGGYATVWKAYDEKDSPVALKVGILVFLPCLLIAFFVLRFLISSR